MAERNQLMKTIQQNEIFEHFSQFLKNRGIELKQGSYSNVIQKGCSLLADTINLSQKGIEKAKSGIDEKLDQVRQVIHEKTAPRTPPPSPATSAAGSAAKKPARRAKPAKKSAPRKSSSSKGRKGS